METKQSIKPLRTTNTAPSKDKKYVFNLSLCYFILDAFEGSSIVLRVSNHRNKGTNTLITVENIVDERGSLFDNSTKYLGDGEGKKRKINYDQQTRLPIVDYMVAKDDRRLNGNDRSDLTTILLDQLKESPMFEQVFDQFWKCHIHESERSTADYSQIVYMPLITNRKKGQRILNTRDIRFVEKREYLEREGETIVLSFLEQFELQDKQTKGTYLIISDSIDYQMQMLEKYQNTHHIKLITRHEMLNIIEYNLTHDTTPRFEQQPKDSRKRTNRVSNSEPVSPINSIINSEDTHPLNVFQPTPISQYVIVHTYGSYNRSHPFLSN